MILLLLVFIEATKVDNPRDLCVVFDPKRPLISKGNNAFSKLMAASNTSKAFLNYKFTIGAVAEFQVVYKNAKNK